MRRAARIDRNQPEIVKALRAVGCSVQVLSEVGKGCPDLLVGWTRHLRGEEQRLNLLLEVKDENQPPSKRHLTTDQVEWHRDWRGQVRVVESIADALAAVGVNVARDGGR